MCFELREEVRKKKVKPGKFEPVLKKMSTRAQEIILGKKSYLIFSMNIRMLYGGCIEIYWRDWVGFDEDDEGRRGDDQDFLFKTFL